MIGAFSAHSHMKHVFFCPSSCLSGVQRHCQGDLGHLLRGGLHGGWAETWFLAAGAAHGDPLQEVLTHSNDGQACSILFNRIVWYIYKHELWNVWIWSMASYAISTSYSPISPKIHFLVRPLTMMSGSFQPSERGVVDQACDDGAVATGKQKCDGGFEGWKLEVFQVVLPNLHPKCKKPKERERARQREREIYERDT